MTPETPSNHPGADDSLIPPSFVPGARRQRPAPRQDPPQAAAPAPRRTSAHQAGASQAPPQASAGRSGSTPRRPLSQRLPQPGTPGGKGGQPGGDGSPRQPRPVPQAPKDSTTIPVKNEESDEKIEEIYKPFHHRLCVIADEEIGETLNDMVPKEKHHGVSAAFGKDTGMSSFITDVELYYSGADVVSFAYNYENVRLDKGKIRRSL